MRRSRILAKPVLASVPRPTTPTSDTSAKVATSDTRSKEASADIKETVTTSDTGTNFVISEPSAKAATAGEHINPSQHVLASNPSDGGIPAPNNPAPNNPAPNDPAPNDDGVDSAATGPVTRGRRSKPKPNLARRCKQSGPVSGQTPPHKSPCRQYDKSLAVVTSSDVLSTGDALVDDNVSNISSNWDRLSLVTDQTPIPPACQKQPHLTVEQPISAVQTTFPPPISLLQTTLPPPISSLQTTLPPPISSLQNVAPAFEDTEKVSSLHKTSTCSVTADDLKKPKRRPRYRVRWKEDEPQNHNKMTMRDLIYWNPKRNHMKEKEDKNNNRVEGQLDKTCEENSLAPLDADDDSNSAAPVPQVTIGPDGFIIINEESMVLDMDAPRVMDEYVSELLEENENDVTYMSFRKRTRYRAWTFKETLRFYRALAVVGTDFTLMQRIFRERTRAEIKRKYNREERKNAHLIDRALSDRVSELDMTIFESESESEDYTEIPAPAKGKRKASATLDATSPAEKKPRKKRLKKGSEPLVTGNDVVGKDEVTGENETRAGNNILHDAVNDFILSVESDVLPKRIKKSSRKGKNKLNHGADDDVILGPEEDVTANADNDVSLNTMNDVASKPTVKRFSPYPKKVASRTAVDDVMSCAMNDVTANVENDVTFRSTNDVTPKPKRKYTRKRPKSILFDSENDVTTNDAPNVSTNGAPDVTTNGAPDVTTNGAPDVTSNGAPDVTSKPKRKYTRKSRKSITCDSENDVTTIDAPNVTTNGAPDVTTNGAPDVTSKPKRKYARKSLKSITCESENDITANDAPDVTMKGFPDVTHKPKRKYARKRIAALTPGVEIDISQASVNDVTPNVHNDVITNRDENYALKRNQDTAAVINVTHDNVGDVSVSYNAIYVASNVSDFNSNAMSDSTSPVSEVITQDGNDVSRHPVFAVIARVTAPGSRVDEATPLRSTSELIPGVRPQISAMFDDPQCTAAAQTDASRDHSTPDRVVQATNNTPQREPMVIKFVSPTDKATSSGQNVNQDDLKSFMNPIVEDDLSHTTTTRTTACSMTSICTTTCSNHVDPVHIGNYGDDPSVNGCHGNPSVDSGNYGNHSVYSGNHDDGFADQISLSIKDTVINAHAHPTISTSVHGNAISTDVNTIYIHSDVISNLDHGISTHDNGYHILCKGISTDEDFHSTKPPHQSISTSTEQTCFTSGSTSSSTDSNKQISNCDATFSLNEELESSVIFFSGNPEVEETRVPNPRIPLPSNPTTTMTSDTTSLVDDCLTNSAVPRGLVTLPTILHITHPITGELLVIHTEDDVVGSVDDVI